jgi:hypothetical protein
VWPEFPWQQAYDSFFAEYSQLCTMEELYPDPRLEMVARCVVETGTTAYYHTLRELSDEPVLSELLGNIRNDEVNHFKHFLKYFKELQQQSPVGRTRIAKALYGRLKELRESDSDIALRHVWAHKGPYFSDSSTRFEDMAQRIYELVSRRLPADLAVRMLLKPMLLPARVEGMVRTPISKLARNAYLSLACIQHAAAHGGTAGRGGLRDGRGSGACAAQCPLLCRQARWPADCGWRFSLSECGQACLSACSKTCIEKKAQGFEQPVPWMRDKELTAARRRYCPRTSGAAPPR